MGRLGQVDAVRVLLGIYVRFCIVTAGSPDATRSGALRTKVVDVVHEATGTVRLRSRWTPRTRWRSIHASAKTVRVTKG